MAHPDQQNRVKMECPTCGYRSYPQWMNNKAHCLKCDAVLKTRPNTGPRGAAAKSRGSPGPAARAAAPAARAAPMSEEDRLKMRFRSLDVDGDGTLTFDEMSSLLRRGDPNFTDEQLHTLFEGADQNGNGVIEFDEFVDFIHSPPATAPAAPNRSGRPASREHFPPAPAHDRGHMSEEEEEPRVIPKAKSPARVTKPAHPDQQNRVKMECPQCGYKSYPQWMNDKAHCLKCDAVLKTRQGAHGRGNSRGRAFGH